jgi:hypothetical protein
MVVGIGSEPPRGYLLRRRPTRRRRMTHERRTTVNTTDALKRIVAGALLSGSVAVSGFGVARPDTI